MKRIKASTLMETLVATVLIVIVFMVASMVLNSLFAAYIAQNDNEIRQQLLQLQYQYQYGKLDVPHYEEVGAWDIAVTKVLWNASEQIVFTAEHSGTKREISYKILNE